MSAHVYLGLAAYHLLVLGIGCAVLYALGLVRSRRLLPLLGVAYLTGWGVLGTLLSYALIGGMTFDLETVAVVTVVILLASGAAGRRTPPVGGAVTPASGPAPRIAALAAGAVILLAGAAALVLAVRADWAPDFDTVALWIPHAEVVYYEHGLSVGPSGWHQLAHPEYPPGNAVMDALCFRFVGGFHPSLLAFDQCLLGLAFVGSVLSLLGRCVPRWLALPSIALLVVSPEFFTRLDSLLPDQTLAYFVASAALASALWLRERRGAWLALAVLLSIAGTLTKLEGDTYALLLATIVVAGAALGRGRRAALPALVLFLGAAAIEPWRLWLGAHGLSASAEDYRLSNLLHPLYAAHRADRIPTSAEFVLEVMFKPGRWLVVLPLALLAIAAASRLAPLAAAGAGVWLLLAFAGLIVVYWIGQFGVITLHDELSTSAHRVASTIVIVAGTIAPLILALALERQVGMRPPAVGPERSSPEP